MFIASKGIILNFSNMQELYTGTNGTAVVAKQTDGKLYVLQEYENARETDEAIAIIAKEIELGKKDLVYVPDSREVKARIANNGDGQWHLSGGRKQKGHGGS